MHKDNTIPPSLLSLSLSSLLSSPSQLPQLRYQQHSRLHQPLQYPQRVHCYASKSHCRHQQRLKNTKNPALKIKILNILIYRQACVDQIRVASSRKYKEKERQKEENRNSLPTAGKGTRRCMNILVTGLRFCAFLIRALSPIYNTRKHNNTRKRRRKRRERQRKGRQKEKILRERE